MTRPLRVARNIGVAAIAFLLLLAAFTRMVVKTDWFRNFVRQQIVAAVGNATGGRVELQSFNFEVSGLRATAAGLVIHGKEPPGSPPFFRIPRLEADFQLFHISRVRIERPEANIMLLADGQTNIPEPKQQPSSGDSPLAKVVDLAIRRFELTDGLFTADSRQQPLNIKGNNLRALLNYNFQTSSYEGQLSLDPLYTASGRNTPVRFTVTVPLALGRDRIDIRNASISTAKSRIAFNGSIENLRNPQISAKISGRVATLDLKNAAGLPLTIDTRNTPAELTFDANANISADVIRVADLSAAFGRSSFTASGAMKDPKGTGALDFNSQLYLAELGRLFNTGNLPREFVDLSGSARLGRDLEIKRLRLAALGGEFLGNASFHDPAHYQLTGRVQRLDIQTMLKAAGQSLPYGGVVSGQIDASSTGSVVAMARLDIAPVRRGIPLSGHVDAEYNSVLDDVSLKPSYLALPHTRLALSGSVRKTLDLALNTRDLNDFFHAPWIALSPAGLEFKGAVTGSLTSPHISGHLAAGRFTVEARTFDSLAADIEAAPARLSVRNGSLNRGAMNMDFGATAGLRKWVPDPREPLSADLSLNRGDLADAVALAGEPTAGYAGALTAMAHVAGTIGNPQGTAHLQLESGTIAGEPFDRADAQIDLKDQLVTVPAAYIQSAAGRLNLNADFTHPRDSFTSGQLHARLQGAQIDIGRIPTAHASGTLHIDTDVQGTIAKSELLLTAINGQLSGRGLRFEGQDYGTLDASARTSGQTVSYTLASDFAGSNIHVNGNTQLARDYPTQAEAQLTNLPLERLLAAADRPDVSARGTLAGTASFKGNISSPQAAAELTLTGGSFYDEPIDLLRARVNWLQQSVEVSELGITSGASRVDVTARYDHPAGNLQKGNAQFTVKTSRIDLARVRNIQKLRPGLAGAVEMTAHGAAAVEDKEPRIRVTALDANASATGIAAQGKSFGSLNLTANTDAANRLKVALDSNLADASIHGSGNVGLTGDYPIEARVTFTNLLYTRIMSLLTTDSGQPPAFEGVSDGQVTLIGPALKPDEMSGGIQLTRMAITTRPRPGTAKPVSIANQGPIAIALDHGLLKIQSAHITGPQTNMEVSGTASLRGGTLDLAAKADANLAVLADFNRDIYSSGRVVLATTVKGTVSQPSLNGQVTLQNASLNYTGITNGISNANGVIVLNGNSAMVRTLTAESGGGRITASGNAGFGGSGTSTDAIRFSLRTQASDVRIRIEQGVSMVAGGDLRLTGTMKSSTLSGSVTVDQVTWNPQSDIGSVLSRATTPVKSADAPSALLASMKLDIRVRSAAGLGVQASLAQNLQADADLRVRGTAAEPGILGRISINEGQLVFFGSTYTVDSGTISFYDPLRVAPVLDLSLATEAHGVDVVLRVTGPVDDMKLSYTSNPPLQFSEIVALLASGKATTTDATLLANQPAMPQQSFQQMGESAIVGKALADPVSGRLQRVFGVTQLKIDPAFQTGSTLPTARLTLQQRITGNVTFTYTSALDDPNGQIIKVEWALNPTWSAIATRDQNGLFSINFFYKKQFR